MGEKPQYTEAQLLRLLGEFSCTTAIEKELKSRFGWSDKELAKRRGSFRFSSLSAPAIAGMPASDE